MRAIPNLLKEAEVLIDAGSSTDWLKIWASEVLGRAIGHEIRHWLETPGPDKLPYYGDLIGPALSRELVKHHIADVL